MAGTTALINGVNYSWSNVSLVYAGVVMVGITKISFTKKQEKTNNYGWGQEPVSRGYGRVSYENGSIEIYMDELKRLAAAAPNKNILDIPSTDMYLVYGGSKVLPSSDTIEAIEFLEDPFSANEGDTKLLVTIPIIFAGMKRS